MRTTLLDRLLDKIDVRIVTGCWEWTASKINSGYGRLSVNGKPELAHRVAYKLLAADIPHDIELDHVCHNRGCVNPAHLRLASKAENLWTQPQSRASTTGFKGIYFHGRDGKYVAQITANGKRVHIGNFNTAEEAYTAYCSAAIEHHGNFANLGHPAHTDKEANT